MAITTQFLTGFEHGFIGAAATAGGWPIRHRHGPASWSASTSSPRNGSYCAHFVAPANTITKIAFTVPGNPTKVVLRFGLKLSARPTSLHRELLAYEASAASDHFQIIGQLEGSSGYKFLGVPVAGQTDRPSTRRAGISSKYRSTFSARPSIGRSTVLRTHGSTVLAPRLTLPPSTGQPRRSWLSPDRRLRRLIFGTWTDAATDWYGDGKVLAQLPGFDGFHQTPTAFSVGDAGAAYTGSQSIWGNVDDPPGTLGWTATRNTTDNMAMRVANTTAYLEIDPAVTTEAGQANAVRATVVVFVPRDTG